jgi:hypothetical protein
MQEQYLTNTVLKCAYFFHFIGNALSTSSKDLLALTIMSERKQCLEAGKGRRDSP